MLPSLNKGFTHSLTHPLTHSPTHPLTHSPTHPLTHSPTHPLTHSPTHPLTHSPTHPLTHSPTHPLTHPLPSFDGNFKVWAAFWDSFDSAINSNQSLTPIEKFSYLRASLRGSAAATINGLSLSSANYEAAVALLKERYGDSQKIY